MFSVCESSSLSERFSDSPKNLIHTHSLAGDLIYNNVFWTHPPLLEFIQGLLAQTLPAFSNSKQCKQAVSALY